MCVLLLAFVILLLAWEERSCPPTESRSWRSSLVVFSTRIRKLQCCLLIKWSNWVFVCLTSRNKCGNIPITGTLNKNVWPRITLNASEIYICIFHHLIMLVARIWLPCKWQKADAVQTVQLLVGSFNRQQFDGIRVGREAYQKTIGRRFYGDIVMCVCWVKLVSISLVYISCCAALRISIQLPLLEGFFSGLFSWLVSSSFTSTKMILSLLMTNELLYFLFRITPISNKVPMTTKAISVPNTILFHSDI